VWKRNERERYRVRCVNEVYERLRTQLPAFGLVFYLFTSYYPLQSTVPNFSDRRLSKVDTLRLAIDYIKHLELLLANPLHDHECQCFVNTLSSVGSGSQQGSGMSGAE